MENLIVEVKGSSDYVTCAQFFRFMLFKGKNYKTLPRFVFALFIILGVFSAAIVAVSREFIFLILLGLDFFALAMYLFLWFVVPKITYKRAKEMGNHEIVYKFYPDCIDISSTGENINGNEKINWTAYKTFYEVESAFYLFLGGVAHIIPKKDLTDNQKFLLSAFLSTSFPDKYMRCCKSPKNDVAGG